MRKGGYVISKAATLFLFNLWDKYGESAISDVLGSLQGTYVAKAKEFAEFIKQSKGDFSPVSRADIQKVLAQMVKNEANLKNISRPGGRALRKWNF